MGLSRSTFYDAAPAALGADGLVGRISAICDEFECYGYRRVGAALRHEGVVVNGKKLRRLIREHGLQPKRRRRVDRRPLGPLIGVGGLSDRQGFSGTYGRDPGAVGGSSPVPIDTLMG